MKLNNEIIRSISESAWGNEDKIKLHRELISTLSQAQLIARKFGLICTFSEIFKNYPHHMTTNMMSNYKNVDSGIIMSNKTYNELKPFVLKYVTFVEKASGHIQSARSLEKDFLSNEDYSKWTDFNI